MATVVSGNPRLTDAGFASPSPAAPASPPPGAPAAAPPSPTAGGAAPSPQAVGGLGTDPAYLAYMRSLGLSQADAQAAATQAEGATKARLMNSIGDLYRTGDLRLAATAGRYEARGIGNSSEALIGEANVQAAQAAREAALRQQAAQGEATLAANLGLKMQQGQVGAANAALTAGQNVSLANASAPLGAAPPAK